MFAPRVRKITAHPTKQRVFAGRGNILSLEACGVVQADNATPAPHHQVQVGKVTCAIWKPVRWKGVTQEDNCLGPGTLAGRWPFEADSAGDIRNVVQVFPAMFESPGAGGRRRPVAAGHSCARCAAW